VAFAGCRTGIRSSVLRHRAGRGGFFFWRTMRYQQIIVNRLLQHRRLAVE
jgi:hypothetical protein